MKLRRFEAPWNSNEPSAVVLSARFKAALRAGGSPFIKAELQQLVCVQRRPSGQAKATAHTPTAAGLFLPQGRRERPPSPRRRVHLRLLLHLSHLLLANGHPAAGKWDHANGDHLSGVCSQQAGWEAAGNQHGNGVFCLWPHLLQPTECSC